MPLWPAAARSSHCRAQALARGGTFAPLVPVSSGVLRCKEPAPVRCISPCRSARVQKMTYVTQLEEYEEAVMKKRLEEMTEDEVQRLMQESEASRKK